MAPTTRVPNIAHFVFGLKERPEPLHFVHYVAIESCRRVLAPDAILLHHRHRPWGPWWDRVAPYLELRRVELVPEVLGADYADDTVPAAYRYAHHADFIRLDALIEHGGVYADMDMVFVRPLRPDLFEHPFVIGAEPPVTDERTGALRPSLCNAVLMAEPGAAYARAWRAQMADELNGTWSNHSGFLSQALRAQMPDAVHVEPPETFFSFPADRSGLARLLEERHPVPVDALGVHLWAHLWWERGRRDFSEAHEGWCTPSAVRRARTTFADLARPYVPPGETTPPDPLTAARREPDTQPWMYLSFDEASGYGVAADRCRAALEASGVEVDWTPFVPGGGWGLGYQPPPAFEPVAPRAPGQVVVAHLVAEYFPEVRRRCPDALLVGHTVWDTTRVPGHWERCLDAADLVVVPSRFSAEALGRSSSSTPVAVVPHVAAAGPPATGRPWAGIDPEVFVFYTIAEWTERKAVFLTIEAFLRAFTADDPVVLVVKTSHHDRRCPPPPGRRAVEPGSSAWALARLLAHHPRPPAVQLVTRHVREDEITAIHHRGDCFVSLCRSEGWGLGAFDAAVHGNPVVTTAFGGHLDYLAGSPYLVRCDLVPVEDPAGFPSYAPDQRWAQPDVDHGAALLRQVVTERRPAADWAAARAEDLRWRYRPAAVAAAFRQALASCGAGAGAPGVPPVPAR
ncbi:MAG TPA: glycosyltransferase [Acidimicrobiales bacterium]|nr:glycosyltransferase [Acidimicrobiales bacterium]